MSTKDKSEWKDLGFAFLLLAVTGWPLLWLRAWALLKSWTWLLVPLGLPEVSLWHALGIAWLVMTVAHQAKANDPEDKARSEFLKAARAVITSLFWSLGLLAGSEFCRWMAGLP